MAREKIRGIRQAITRKRFTVPLLLGLIGVFFIISRSFLSAPSPPQPRIKIPQPPPPQEKVLSGRISRGETLSSALRSKGLPKDLVENLCSRISPVLNLRQTRPGDTFEVRLDLDGRFLALSYQSSAIDIAQLALLPSGEWKVQKKEVPVDKYWTRVSGEISSSLFATMNLLGEQDQLVLDMAEIFSWEIDFHSEIQPGDRFQLIVEEYYAGDTFVKYGKILYAEFDGQQKKSAGLYYQPPRGEAGYYTPQGDSLRKELLRSPIKFTRITSGYSRSRRHPILGGTRPHLGIDYAAPLGTPVVAAAEGIVTTCGWNGGFGKQVIIHHARGYQSMYGHLSRFGPGITKGKKVRQKQIIGYVGSTGLSTGPHLDFRLLKNNTFRNPLREIVPRAEPLGKNQIGGFLQDTEAVRQWMRDPATPKHRKEASMTSGDLAPPRKPGKKP
jgi:murein DD-endopeptidase MepM/ murein hydrolase activator NlpD